MKPIPERKKTGFKAGANKGEQLKITKLHADGVSASEISHRLKIRVDVIEGWLPKKKRTKKTTPKNTEE